MAARRLPFSTGISTPQRVQLTMRKRQQAQLDTAAPEERSDADEPSSPRATPQNQRKCDQPVVLSTERLFAPLTFVCRHRRRIAACIEPQGV